MGLDEHTTDELLRMSLEEAMEFSSTDLVKLVERANHHARSSEILTRAAASVGRHRPARSHLPPEPTTGVTRMGIGRYLFRKQKQYLISNALDDYAADFTLRGCKSGKSLRSEIAALKRRFDGLAVADLTIASLRRLQADLRNERLSAATVNKQLAILSAALNLAATNEIIQSVPRFPRRLRPAAPRQGFLEHDDYLAIRGELPEWGRPILDFGYYAGWRRNEILTLSPAEVDLERNQIRLHPDRSKNRDARVLPLMGFGLDAVVIAMKSSQSATVFHRDGKRVSPTYWHEVWSKSAKRAGRKGKYFHDLRRTVVRRLELAGVPRKTAMAWVGHRTEAIYLRYSITTEKDLVPAAEKMLRHLSLQVVAPQLVPFRPKKGD